MKTMYKITTTLTLIFTISVFWLGSIAIHIYTIAEVKGAYGLFWGIISFFCPIISQIVLFILKVVNGAFRSPYCITILLYIGAVALTFLFQMISSYLEISIKEKE